MRVVVHQLMGKSIEFNLDASANLRELQLKIASTLGSEPSKICICRMQNQDGVKLSPIFHDDPADENLLEFIKRQAANPEIQINELTIFLKLNLGAGHYRPTQQNPDGVSAYCGLIDNPGSKFFQAAMAPALSESFSAQFERLGLIDEAPETFFDPISFKIMDIPVIASDLRTYNLQTLIDLNFVSPFSRRQLSRTTQDNLSLRAEMSDFIRLHQKLEPN